MYRIKRIINTTAYGILTVAALGVSACTNNYFYCCPESGGGGGEQNKITLSSEVHFGVHPRLQDTQIFNGQRLSLFVTRTGSVTF